MDTRTWSEAAASVRAHRGGMAGPALVLALAAALLSATGVLMESGVRSGGASLLPALAGSFAGTALLVVVLVVASTVALAMRQRRRELALLRAVGATRTQVRRRIAAELVLVTAVAAPLGAIPGLWLARLTGPILDDAGIVDDDFTFALSPVPVLVAWLLLLPLAVLAARLAARETLRLPPTEAVRSTAAETRHVGGVRRALAAGTAVLGLTAAGSGLVVPGTIGAASAATSALLLVGAAALAGPLLVTWALDRTAPLSRRLRGPASRLAFANSRGFSQRLATVVVPLAAALALGTVQSATDQAIVQAAEGQLRDGIHADLVVVDPDGLRPDEVAAIGATEGVERATPLASVDAEVRTDDEEVPGLEGLSWEPGSLRVLPDGDPDPAYDPGVVAGSLADLARPDTVAVSTDARFESGHGMGDEVLVRLDGGPAVPLRVVAVYDRGLGFGGYLVGAATPAAHDLTAPVDTVLVTASDGAEPPIIAGHETLSRAAYVDSATASAPQEQRLSLVLLLALLVFVGLGAANALITSTAARREELALLARTGATRRQLVTMAAVESLVVAAVAWAIGTLAVLPAVFGVSAGLLGAAVPAVDVTTYAVLSLGVLAIAVLSIVPTVALRIRR